MVFRYDIITQAIIGFKEYLLTDTDELNDWREGSKPLDSLLKTERVLVDWSMRTERGCYIQGQTVLSFL